MTLMNNAVLELEIQAGILAYPHVNSVKIIQHRIGGL
jgi:hypothetical protein